MATAIEVRGLRKSFGAVEVLKGVNLEVERGGIFALLGSNGAGKTTTVKILATLLRADGGTAAVNGFDVAKDPAGVRRSISLTGQFAAVDEILTGRENLVMIARLRHLGNPRRVADDLLNRFGLADAADRRVSTYSGGMRRRLDIAMSLPGNPAVLFLDEPTTGLDPRARIEVWKTVKELAGSGTTVFLTTQYLEEAERLAGRIAILRGGRIVARGTPEELKARLPHGRVELRFARAAELRAALGALGGGYPAKPDEAALSVAVDTDGSAGQFADVLNRMEGAGVPVAGFSRKLPTLEDVFLAVTGKKEEA